MKNALPREAFGLRVVRHCLVARDNESARREHNASKCGA
jgi:hypothetical protein